MFLTDVLYKCIELLSGWDCTYVVAGCVILFFGVYLFRRFLGGEIY